MTPELLTFLDEVKTDGFDGLYALIVEAEKRRKATPEKDTFYQSVKTSLEDLIHQHRQNRVFVFSKGKLEILTVGDYCDRYHVATLDQMVFDDERCIYRGSTSAKEPAATTSAPLALTMIETYVGNDVSLSDEWFNTISETAYAGCDATALEMLCWTFEWTYTYQDWLKMARKIQKGKDEDLEDISKTWSEDTKTVLVNPENPKTKREMMRLSGLLAYLSSLETLRQEDRNEALGQDNVTVRVRRKTFRFGKAFKFQWGKEIVYKDKD